MKELTLKELMALPKEDYIWVVGLSADGKEKTGYSKVKNIGRIFNPKSYSYEWVAYRNKEEAQEDMFVGRHVWSIACQRDLHAECPTVDFQCINCKERCHFRLKEEIVIKQELCELYPGYVLHGVNLQRSRKEPIQAWVVDDMRAWGLDVFFDKQQALEAMAEKQRAADRITHRYPSV